MEVVHTESCSYQVCIVLPQSLQITEYMRPAVWLTARFINRVEGCKRFDGI